MAARRRVFHRQAAQGLRPTCTSCTGSSATSTSWPSRDFEPIPNTDKIDLTLTFDEGKQFFVRRIDFSGNTTTRDKVIRRQLLVDEGDIFNTHLWELSILRLNQLGYFEVLKEDDRPTSSATPRTNTVDITLKVKERGKNSMQLNGGVSGIAGSFVGFSYSTNNFLGLGETLSLSTQLGHAAAQRAVRIHRAVFPGPAAAGGFHGVRSRFDYNQAREASILAGHEPDSAVQPAGHAEPAELLSNSHGFTVFAAIR